MKMKEEIGMKNVRLFILKILIVSMLAGCSTSTDVRVEEIQLENKAIAMACAQDMLKEYLAAPSTAVFPPFDEHKITQTGTQFRIEGYVDAENAAGVMSRSAYIVIIEFENEKMEAFGERYVELGGEVYLDKTDEVWQ
jgi:hypothetical protein